MKGLLSGRGNKRNTSASDIATTAVGGPRGWNFDKEKWAEAGLVALSSLTSSSAAATSASGAKLAIRCASRTEVAAQADSPLYVAFNSIPYYEVRIRKLPSPRGIVAIGLAPAGFALKGDFPGWRPGTFGWHSDDGHFFCGDGEGSAYATGGRAGDVIGCGVTQRGDEIFFTLNGKYLGSAVRMPLCELRDAGLFPTVGLDGKGTEVEANFGQQPFVFDYAVIMRNETQKTRVLSYSMAPNGNNIADAIQSYRAAGAVNRTMHELSTHNALWKPLFLAMWPKQNSGAKFQSWFKFFKRRHQTIKQAMPVLGDPQKIKGKLAADLAPIENCVWEFKCPILWKSMKPIADSPHDVELGHELNRKCETCNEVVHFVTTPAELSAEVARGHCVAFVERDLMPKPKKPKSKPIKRPEVRRGKIARW